MKTLQFTARRTIFLKNLANLTLETIYKYPVIKETLKCLERIERKLKPIHSQEVRK